MDKTLLICDIYPLPEISGGAMRTMNFVRFLKENGTVDIAYSYIPEGGVSENSIFTNKYCLIRKDLDGGWKQHLHRMFLRIPYPIQEYSDDSRRFLKNILISGNYDHVIVRYVQNAYHLLRMNGCFRSRMIIDFDDLLSGSLYNTFFRPTKSFIRKGFRQLNKLLLQNYERQCLKSGISLFCSEEDLKRIVPEAQREYAFVVPNIYDGSEFENYEFGDGFGNKNTLLFVGTLNYPPNAIGLQWFLESIFEEFKKKYKNSKLLVIGRNPPDEVRKMCASVDGVELHADVADVREYYGMCGTVVVPLLAGGGTRIKILEASLAGRPVLSTPVGAEGLTLTDGKQLLLFRDFSEFIAKFEMMCDRNYYNSLFTNAKKVVLEKYSKQMFEDSMKRLLH